MSHNVCIKAHRKLEDIREAIDNGQAINAETALRYLLDRAICKDHGMNVDWKAAHREEYGAVYPEDHNSIALAMDDVDIDHWIDHMKNANGTAGAHWTRQQTAEVAKKHGITIDPLHFWAAMNMMWSDYYDVAKANNVDTVAFYAGMAKAFCNDPDAPADKLERYIAAMM